MNKFPPTKDWPQPEQETRRLISCILQRREKLARDTPKPMRVRQASMGSTAGILTYQLVRACNAHVGLEIGACVGIGSAYICLGLADNCYPEVLAKFITLEGDPAKAQHAQRTLDLLIPPEKVAARVVIGRFEQRLAVELDKLKRELDFVYLDGHHQEEPTVTYFQQCVDVMRRGVILVDDINYNSGMVRAIARLKQHPRVLDTRRIHNKLAFLLG